METKQMGTTIAMRKIAHIRNNVNNIQHKHWDSGFEPFDDGKWLKQTHTRLFTINIIFLCVWRPFSSNLQDWRRRWSGKRRKRRKKEKNSQHTKWRNWTVTNSLKVRLNCGGKIVFVFCCSNCVIWKMVLFRAQTLNIISKWCNGYLWKCAFFVFSIGERYKLFMLHAEISERQPWESENRPSHFSATE